MGRQMKDETGKRYGRLKVIRAIKQRDPNNACIIWECECDCGNTTYVRSSNLRYGNTMTCGNCRKMR